MTLTQVIINPLKLENVLKGQNILAQGNALGINAITKGMVPISQQTMQFYSVRNNFIAIFILFSRTVSAAIPLPGAVPPGYAILPFQGEKSRSFGL